MDDKFCNLSVGFIGKTAEIWNKQEFAKEFKLLEGNPLESVSWRGVDIGFLIADGREKEEVSSNIEISNEDIDRLKKKSEQITKKHKNNGK